MTGLRMEEREKGRGGGDRYLFRRRGREEDGEEEKGVEKESRDWLMAGLRQGPQLARRRSTEHQAACSTSRALRCVP